MLEADITQMSNVSNSTNSEPAHNHSPAFCESLELWKVKFGFREVPYICIRKDYIEFSCFAYRPVRDPSGQLNQLRTPLNGFKNIQTNSHD